MIRGGAQMNTKNEKIQSLMFYQEVSLPYCVQKLDWWTKLFTPFLSLFLSHINQLLLGSACYCLGKVIILLETVGSAFGLWKKELCCGSQVLQILVPVEGSGELHSWIPPHSAQALQKMWELFFRNHHPCNIVFPSKFWEHYLFFFNK